MSVLVRNLDHLVTLDEKSTVLSNVDILVEGNRIVTIGPSLDVYANEIVDGVGKIAMPGMVNTHHHLFQSLTRCVPAVQEEELFGWLTTLYTIWQDLTPEGVYAGTLLGLAELMSTGCTTSTDMFYLFPKSAPADLFDQQIQAARDLGIRFHPTRGSMSMGKSKGGLPPDDVVQDEDVIMADCERVIGKFHDPDPLGMIKIALAPCAPFTVTPQLLKDSVTLARKHGVRLHTHLAETKDEDVYCKEHYNCRPFEFMEQVGWVGPDIWYAHAVHLNQREIEQCAKTGTGIAHCPTSNMRLGSGTAPIPEMLKAGVPVGLGVDGSSSNDSGDMFGEVRNCLLAHRARTGTRSMTAEMALRVAVQGGARVLGYQDIGMIKEGMGADFVLVNLRQIAYAGAAVHDPVASLVFAGDSHIVDTSIINGKVVVKDGRLVSVSEDKIIDLANRVAKDMINKAHKRTGIDYWSRRESASMPRDMAREASRLVKEQVARLKPVQKAAVLLHALADDVIREVSRNLTEAEVRVLLPEMNRFPNTASVETVGVVNEFLHIHKLWNVLGGVLTDSQEILHALQRWATRNPRRMARLLRDSWLSGRN